MNKMNIRGQILDHPVIAFFIVLFGLLLLAPILLKVMNSISTPLSANLGNITSGGSLAQANFDKVTSVGIGMMDKVIVFAFFILIIMMFISAFLIDNHPFWIIMYILLSFFLVLFAPNIVSSLDNIYGSAQFATEANQLSFMYSIQQNFGIFIVGMIVFTGIIIYGKLRFFSTGGSARR